MSAHGSVQAATQHTRRDSGWNLSRVLIATPLPLWLGLIVACAALIGETLLAILLRRFTPEAGFGTVYMVGVLVVAIGWRRGLAAAMVVASAAVFAYFRSWPNPSFDMTRVHDWVAVALFLTVALLANAITGLARARAAEAESWARQQAALRRVATAVAHGSDPTDVLTDVARELGEALGVDNVALNRYEDDGAAVVIAARDTPPLTKLTVGERFSLEEGSIATAVWRDRRTVRIDPFDRATGLGAERARSAGFLSGVGAPIMVNGRVWGSAIVGSARAKSFPPETEARLTDFADLVATAIANAQARLDLAASRRRIVTAADSARHQLERDLHDGAQQRLVSLGIQLRTATMSMPPGVDDAVTEQIADVTRGLTDLCDDLREISRGIHPAILSKGGLGPALKGLARRSAVPVDLEVDIRGRMPDSVEVAAYYVVAEALTNAARHADASEVTVRVTAADDRLDIGIHDDGSGGADPAQGSGLLGLNDRVAALGGDMRIISPAGGGTTLRVTIPCVE